MFQYKNNTWLYFFVLYYLARKCVFVLLKSKLHCLHYFRNFVVSEPHINNIWLNVYCSYFLPYNCAFHLLKIIITCLQHTTLNLMFVVKISASYNYNHILKTLIILLFTSFYELHFNYIYLLLFVKENLLRNAFSIDLFFVYCWYESSCRMLLCIYLVYFIVLLVFYYSLPSAFACDIIFMYDSNTYELRQRIVIVTFALFVCTLRSK